jgi:hypothetical protein
MYKALYACPVSIVNLNAALSALPGKSRVTNRGGEREQEEADVFGCERGGSLKVLVRVLPRAIRTTVRDRYSISEGC